MRVEDRIAEKRHDMATQIRRDDADAQATAARPAARAQP